MSSALAFAVRAAGIVFTLALLPTSATPSYAQPASPTVVFAVNHADCGGSGSGVNSLRFYVNDVLIGVEPTRMACSCDAQAARYEFSGPELEALLDDPSCNHFHVETQGGLIYIGYVRVSISGSAHDGSACIFAQPSDQAIADCSDQVCKPFQGNPVQSTGPDRDGDGFASGIGAGCDVCINAYDPGQADGDGDAFGDFCDLCPGNGNTDRDNDGVCDPFDNCSVNDNPDQSDGDGDGIGDACDFCVGPGREDTDGDGVCDGVDDCQFVFEDEQSDRDGDGAGDVCDLCPDAFSVAQTDSDLDGIGDACDPEICYDFDQDGLGDPARGGEANGPPNECPLDNCPYNFNPGQEDADGDGIGDACDFCVGQGSFDDDGDGVCDDADNCPFRHNPDQADRDGDGFGDKCDECDGPGRFDEDLDAICDDVDDCQFDSNPLQEDGDGDGVGDVCDDCPAVGNPVDPETGRQPDRDFDGIGDACDPVNCQDSDRDGFRDPFTTGDCPHDNCAFEYNPDQQDTDGDGVGDVCDDCPGVVDSAQIDIDQDGIGDACDPVICIDSDRDGFGNPDTPGNQCPPDNCPFTHDPTQSDRDGDGLGDVCDSCPDDATPENDADGVCTAVDNCPNRPNPDQSDADRDGLGDECDPCTDPDHDGFRSAAFPNPFPNACPIDNCPGIANEDQRDTDGDRRGDACDQTDAPLEIRRARVWTPRDSRRPRGKIQLRGTIRLVSAQDRFSVVEGLSVQVRDGRVLNRTFTFAPAECRTAGSGMMRCRGGAKHSFVAHVTPLRRSGGRELRISLSFSGLDIARPFAVPLTVAVTERPGTRTLGTDRVGVIESCTFTGNVPCATPYGSARTAFLRDPGASLLDP